MRKRLISGLMTTALVLSLLGGTALAADTTELSDAVPESTIGGEGQFLDVEDIYDVILPTDLKFKVDPKEALEQGQVFGGQYGVQNHSSQPVKVTVTPYAEVSGDAVTLTDKATVAKANADNDSTKRLLYLELLPAKNQPTATGVDTSNITPSSVVTFDADYATGTAIKEASDTTLTFALDKNEGYETTTGGTFDAGYTLTQSTPADYASDDAIGFSFGGSASQYANWYGVADDSVTVKVKFALVKMTDTEYATFKASPSNGVYALMDGATSGSDDNTPTTYTFTQLSLANKANITCTIPASLTITDVSIYDGATSVKAGIASGTGYTYSNTTITMLGNAGYVSTLSAGKTYKVKITHSAGVLEISLPVVS